MAYFFIKGEARVRQAEKILVIDKTNKLLREEKNRREEEERERGK
jgi:hypothetical protein